MQFVNRIMCVRPIFLSIFLVNFLSKSVYGQTAAYLRLKPAAAETFALNGSITTTSSLGIEGNQCNSGIFFQTPERFTCTCLTGMWAFYSSWCTVPVSIIAGIDYCQELSDVQLAQVSLLTSKIDSKIPTLTRVTANVKHVREIISNQSANVYWNTKHSSFISSGTGIDVGWEITDAITGERYCLLHNVTKNEEDSSTSDIPSYCFFDYIGDLRINHTRLGCSDMEEDDLEYYEPEYCTQFVVGNLSDRSICFNESQVGNEITPKSVILEDEDSLALLRLKRREQMPDYENEEAKARKLSAPVPSSVGNQPVPAPAALNSANIVQSPHPNVKPQSKVLGSPDSVPENEEGELNLQMERFSVYPVVEEGAGDAEADKERAGGEVDEETLLKESKKRLPVFNASNSGGDAGDKVDEETLLQESKKRLPAGVIPEYVVPEGEVPPPAPVPQDPTIITPEAGPQIEVAPDVDAADPDIIKPNYSGEAENADSEDSEDPSLEESSTTEEADPDFVDEKTDMNNRNCPDENQPNCEPEYKAEELGIHSVKNNPIVLNHLCSHVEVKIGAIVGSRVKIENPRKWPTIRILEQSLAILKKTCKALPLDYLDMALDTFINLQTHSLHLKEPYLNHPAFFRIDKALDNCLVIAKPYSFVISNATGTANSFPKGTNCDTQREPSSKQIYHNGKTVDLTMPEDRRGKGFEPIVETIWKILVHSHSYCYKLFSDYFNDHHTFTVSLMPYFNNEVQQIWMPPQLNGTYMEPDGPNMQLYGGLIGDHNIILQDIDNCVAASRIGSAYPWYMNRPAKDETNKWRKRKRRSLEETQLQNNQFCLNSPNDPIHLFSLQQCDF